MIFCFDLDGTLLNSKGIIPDNVIKLIEEIKIKDNIYIVSGRHYSESACFYKQLNLSNDDYLICSDGMYIYDMHGKCIYKSMSLAKNNILFLINDCSISDFIVVTNYGDYYYYKSKIIRLLKTIKGLKMLSSLFEIEDDEIIIEKIIIKKMSEDMMNSVQEQGMKAIRYKDGKVELFHPDVSKYKAIQFLTAIKKETVNNMIYFGDEMNDLECFQNIPYTVSFENANPYIKEMASIITPSNDNGVYEFLKEYLKSQQSF